MVRCLTFATQPRKCTASSALRMIGKVQGKLLGARHDLVEIPPPLEGNAVQKSNRRDSDLNRAGIQLLLIRQIKLVVPDVFGPQDRWGSVEMPSRNMLKLAERKNSASRGDRVPSLHVLGHALAKVRRHWGLPCQMERAAAAIPCLIPSDPIICRESSDPHGARHH